MEIGTLWTRSEVTKTTLPRPRIGGAWQIDGDDAFRCSVGLERHLTVIVESHHHRNKIACDFLALLHVLRQALHEGVAGKGFQQHLIQLASYPLSSCPTRNQSCQEAQQQ